jgi:hypothetical protein
MAQRVTSVFSIDTAIHICKRGQCCGGEPDPHHFGNNFKKRNAASNSQRFAYSSGHRLFILLYCGGMEIHKIKDDSKIDSEKNINRRGPSQIGTV